MFSHVHQSPAQEIRAIDQPGAEQRRGAKFFEKREVHLASFRAPHPPSAGHNSRKARCPSIPGHAEVARAPTFMLCGLVWPRNRTIPHSRRAGAHGFNAAARQAAGGHLRRADDRARLATGGAGRRGASRRRLRRKGDRDGDHGGGRRGDSDAAGSCFRVGPSFRGAQPLRPASTARCRHQSARRPADPGSGYRAHGAVAARRKLGRHRDSDRTYRRSGRGCGFERGEGGCIARSPAACSVVRFTSVAPRCRGAKVRCSIISVCTPTAGRRWRASSRFRPACSRNANGWNNFAPWKTACASTPRSLTRCRSASTRRLTSIGPAQWSRLPDDR